MFEYFPDNDGWNRSLMTLLGENGNINEIDDFCRPLKELSKSGGDAAQEAWYESWRKLAEHVESLAQRDEEAGHYLSAGRKYLRAVTYYPMAERVISNRDPRKLKVYTQMLNAFKKGIQLGQELVEWVEVPFQDTSLPALFVPAIGTGRAPCLVHFNGFDGRKETLYLRIGQEYRRRGIALLIVDHPGVGEALRFRNLYADPATEVPAAACVDYLESRSDVDPERIGIIGISLGGYYAPRAAAFEKRFKCCVAWGACWDNGEQMDALLGLTEGTSIPPFQLLWIHGKDTVEEAVEVGRKMTLDGVADKITCPLLVVHGENDHLVPLWQAERTIEAAVNSPGRKLKVFTATEGGSEHCQEDSSTMGLDYIADWVAETLGGNPKGV